MEKEKLEQTNEVDFVDGSVDEEIEESETNEEVEETTENPQEVDKKSLKELLKEDPDLQEEFNDLIKRRVNRVERDYDSKFSKYEELEGIIGQSMGTSNLDDTLEKTRNFYKQKGVEYTPKRSLREEEILANDEANVIINSCDTIDELKEEANRFSDIGKNNMTPRQKTIFRKIVEEINSKERISELRRIGAKEDVYNSSEFKEYMNMFKPDTSISKIYSMFEKNKNGTKQKEKIGSMKNTPSKKNEVKEFYTKEEALKFTRADFDKNPKLFEAVEKSMSKW